MNEMAATYQTDIERKPLLPNDQTASSVYDKERLNRILEVGRSKASNLPVIMQPVVNGLIMFVESNSVILLIAYATCVVCMTAFVLLLLLVWGGCVNASKTAIFLSMIVTSLGKD